MALAAKDIGKSFKRIGLPLITGCICAGILGGPYGIGIIKSVDLPSLQFINFIALAFIAFAAGNELHFSELRGHLRAIISILALSAVAVIGLGTIALYLSGGALPFLAEMAPGERLAAAVVAATVLIAISPSTIIAVVKELRAKGQFTRIALGVTLLMDVTVIFVFAISSSIADVVFQGASFDLLVLGVLAIELVINVFIGIFHGWLISKLMSLYLPANVKGAAILLLGYIVFTFADFLHGAEVAGIPVLIFSEPLLICMVAGLFIANRSDYRLEVDSIIERFSPPVFVLFFTLLGAEMELKVLSSTWSVLLILVCVRLAGMCAGSFMGSLISPSINEKRTLLGLAFIAQAGVSLSLAKEIGVTFPGWGSQLSTLLMAVIVANTLIGPPFLKFFIHRVREAHVRAKGSVPAGEPLACIFGVEPQSLLLARQLLAHGWQAKLIDVAASRVEMLDTGEFTPEVLESLSVEALRKAGVEKASALVVMLDKDTSYRICELAYENFGTKDLIVRVHDPVNIPLFRELDALVVDPEFAIVNLLDNFVRSPSAASLLLGREANKDVIEIAVTNPQLHGVQLRDVHLPTDTLVLSVRRHGILVLSHGYTRLRLGDEVTIIGSHESLKELRLRFES